MRWYYDYVRRMGQWHLYLPVVNEGLTLCGAPMLSTNRAAYIPVEKRTKCEKCWEVKNKVEAEVNEGQKANKEMDIRRSGSSS